MGLMTAAGLSLKFRARMPHMFSAKKGLKTLQVGRGAQRKLTDAEMAERSVEQAPKPRRLTPLKIAL